MYDLLAPLVGALITIMNGVNSRFVGGVGTIVAAFAIHVVGLAAVSLLLLVLPKVLPKGGSGLLAPREGGGPGTLPFYCYLGGVFGFGTVFSSAYAFSALGASLAVALALLGQTLFSIAADASGFLGRKRYPLSARRLPGIGLALAGIAVMAGGWPSEFPALLVALLAGALPGLSSILNSELGRARGMLRSTRINYLTGLATTLAALAIARPPLAQAARGVAEAGPLLALGGGLMGVAVVTGMNLVFSRMAAFSATLLIFAGEALAGVAIDAAAEGRFDARNLAGALVLLAGLAADALLSRRRAAAS